SICAIGEPISPSSGLRWTSLSDVVNCWLVTSSTTSGSSVGSISIVTYSDILQNLYAVADVNNAAFDHAGHHTQPASGGIRVLSLYRLEAFAAGAWFAYLDHR